MTRDAWGEPVEAEPAQRWDLKELLRYGTRRSRGWIVLFVAAAGVLGLYLGLRQPNVYTSEAKLLLRLGSREQLTPEVLVEVEGELRESRTTMQDEIHMLQDEAIYLRLVQALGPNEVLSAADPARDDDEKTPPWTRTIHDIQSRLFKGDVHGCEPRECSDCLRKAAFVLHENTTLVTEPESNVITVRHTSTSPEKARAITQAIVAAFIDRHADQFSVVPYLEKNRDKLVEAQNRRDAANKAYFDHVQQCGLIDLETQRPALLTTIDELERELFAARIRRDEARVEHKALAERLKSSSSQIDVVREKAPNPAYLDLKTRVDDLAVSALSNDVRIERLEEHLEQERARLGQLRDCEKWHAWLELARTSEQARYATLFRRFSQLEDLGSIDLQDETNLAVLQQATLSVEKEGPNRMKILFGCVVAGVFVGVWFAVMREILDRRLRYPHAIERVLGVRVLGVIPEIEGHKAA